MPHAFCHWIKKERDQTELEVITKKFKICYFSNHISETEDDFYELEKEIQKYEDIRSEKKKLKIIKIMTA